MTTSPKLRRRRLPGVSVLPILPGLWLLLALAPAAASEPRRIVAAGSRSYVVAEPDAPPVTLDDIASRDRLWPFRVFLREPFTPEGAAEPLPLGRPGVLVRIDHDGMALVDHAALGRHRVPVARTDLVEAANRLRVGAEQKMAPNLVLTIGNKLIATTGERLEVYKIPRDAEIDAILCIFADPEGEGFAALAEALAPLAARPELEIVLLPQTAMKDLGTWKRLRAVGLPVPFVRERYKAPFTASLLGDAERPWPWAQLATPEGRLLHEGAWDRGSAAAIAAALPSPARGATAATTP